jgi:phytoene dehydrogenase-like protein
MQMQQKLFMELNKNGGPEEKSCVIIGAGLSGLSAAHKLKRSGWTVMLVEARDRIGGRVFTHFRENRELYCELGGEWVGNNHDSIKKLCKKFRLKLIRHQFDYSFAELGLIADRFKVGEWPSGRQAHFQRPRNITGKGPTQRTRWIGAFSAETHVW